MVLFVQRRLSFLMEYHAGKEAESANVRENYADCCELIFMIKSFYD
jgi:hypothetical protein